MKDKILIIRMMEAGDVAAIGVPALRYVRSRFPDAQVDFLTFAEGEEIIGLAEPDVNVIALEKSQWPEQIVAAMETFLGLAETVIQGNYTEIINLDTWFMPCFLARFLKDAGEPLIGNTLSCSVAELIEQLQQQTLQPDFVNTPEKYMQSSWLSMAQWHHAWWNHAEAPERGYPEFYLRRCCAFADIQMDMHISVTADTSIREAAPFVVALACQSVASIDDYPFENELTELLKKQNISVWQSHKEGSIKNTLQGLKGCDLLVTVPGPMQWYATAVNTPVLLISGQMEPKILMPDYATDPSEKPLEAQQLADGITEILKGANGA